MYRKGKISHSYVTFSYFEISGPPLTTEYFLVTTGRLTARALGTPHATRHRFQSSKNTLSCLHSLTGDCGTAIVLHTNQRARFTRHWRHLVPSREIHITDSEKPRGDFPNVPHQCRTNALVPLSGQHRICHCHHVTVTHGITFFLWHLSITCAAVSVARKPSLQRASKRISICMEAFALNVDKLNIILSTYTKVLLVLAFVLITSAKCPIPIPFGSLHKRLEMENSIKNQKWKLKRTLHPDKHHTRLGESQKGTCSPSPCNEKCREHQQSHIWAATAIADPKRNPSNLLNSTCPMLIYEVLLRFERKKSLIDNAIHGAMHVSSTKTQNNTPRLNKTVILSKAVLLQELGESGSCDVNLDLLQIS
ncbi:hypothetical protein J6590_024906 [Homalodisca vitripennis]|nr:hypothetical protein J6590_024906 [Homalodisca vitripennis]